MRLLACGAALSVALDLEGGWIIEETTNYAVGEKSHSRITIDSQRYKQQTKGETLIIDLKQETVYFVRDSDKSYFGGRIDEVAAELRKNAMSEMNEEDNIFGAAGAVEEDKTILIKKLKERFVASGFSGEKYLILANGEPKKELFIAPKLTAYNEIDPKKLNEIMLWLSGSFATSDQTRIELSDEYIGLIKQGYPIKTIERDPGGGLIQTAVVKAEQKSVASEEFALPKGYAKTNSEEFYRPLE